MAFTINGVEIKKPSDFKIERYNVTTMERLANADMVGDLVAKKVKLYYTYEAITGQELDNILNTIWETDQLFFPVTYDYNGQEKLITAYAGSIPSSLYRAGRSTNWVWKGVTFNLMQK